MSDSKIRIKNIGNDSAPVRLVKMTNDSKVTIEPLGANEPNAFTDSPEDVRFCLAPLKQSEVVVQQAQDDVLGEMILAGIINTKHLDAQTILIEEIVTVTETTVDVLFASRLNNQITGNVERKHQYFLNLGNMTTLGIDSIANISIRASKYLAGNGELVGQHNVEFPKSKVFVTSTKDIIYPMTISELDPNTYLDLVIDLDGNRTLFAPRFHRLNVNVTVESNSEISPVNLRGFDNIFLTETNNFDFGQVRQANSFNIGENTSTKDELIIRSASALFQYKLDESIILKQSFVVEFEHWLIDNSSTITMSIGSTNYTKEEIIAGAKLVNDKYYFLVNVSNKDLNGFVVEVIADYDGPVFNDYVNTHYKYTIVGTVTPKPAIPLFALSSRMASVEVKNENTYYYDGYRYLQFKVPVSEPAMVCIFPDISTENYSVKLLSTPTTLSDITDKQALADFFHIKTDNPILQHVAGKQIAFGFEKAGEAIFQIQVPSGITGKVYFTLRPVGGNGNLMIYDNNLMYLRGVTERLPAPVLDTVSVGNLKRVTIEPETSMEAYYMFSELLMPGQAIAADAIFNSNARLFFMDERQTYIDLLDSSVVVREFPDFAYWMSISSSSANGYRNWKNPTTEVVSKIPFSVDFTSEAVFDTWISDALIAVYRTVENKLILIKFIRQGGIAVGIQKIATLVNNLDDMGYTLDKGMKVVYHTENSTAYKVVEITKPYNVSYEEITTFETDQTLELNAIARLTDISGINAKLTSS